MSENVIRDVDELIGTLKATCYCHGMSSQRRPCQNCRSAEALERLVKLYVKLLKETP